MRSLRLHLALAALSCAGLLVPSAALADSSVSLWSSLELKTKAPTAARGLAPVGPASFHSAAGAAHSAFVPGMRFWASAVGYKVGRRSAGYGMAAGAAVPIGEDLSMTAGYRINGFSSGRHLDGNLDEVERQTAAAYLGFDLEF